MVGLSLLTYDPEGASFYLFHHQMKQIFLNKSSFRASDASLSLDVTPLGLPCCHMRLHVEFTFFIKVLWVCAERAGDRKAAKREKKRDVGVISSGFHVKSLLSYVPSQQPCDIFPSGLSTYVRMCV